VGDIRQRDLTAAPVPAIYLAFRQRPGRIRSATLVAASGTSAPPSAAAVRDGLAALDSEVPATVSPMASFISHSVAMRRFSMLVLAGFATAALALAVVGIHGVVSYGVARRAREVGIRVALGARPRAIRWLMMRDALAAVGAGLILGIIAAWGGTRLLRSVLFGVSPTDPLTFAAVVGLLLATAWIASSLPAGRSTRLDPMRVMRGE
jgi:ABC-type antimicrobial peptide transport system permease subunit